MSARTAIRDWITQEMESQFRWSVFGAVLCLIGGLLGLFVMYWILGFLYWYALSGLLPSPLLRTLAILGTLAALFAGYFLIDFRKLEKVDFESKERMQIARGGSLLTGNSFLAVAAGPKTAMSFVKVCLIILMAVPGLLVLSVQLLQRSLAVREVHAGDMARALLQTLRVEQRLPLDQAFAGSKSLDARTLKQQLLLLDGVIIREDDPPGMYLTDGLRQKLVEAATSANDGPSEE